MKRTINEEIANVQSLHIIKNEHGKSFILENQLSSIGDLFDFMHQVIYGKESYYYMTTSSSGKRNQNVTALGHYLPLMKVFASTFVSGCQYHPLLLFFYDQYRLHSIQRCISLSPLMHGDKEGRKVWEVFDDFLSFMRKQARAECLKKRVLDWESKSRKNYTRSLKLTKRLFNRYARLMVIRLDLHHKAISFKQEEIQNYMDEARAKEWQDAQAFESGKSLNDFEPLQGRVSFETVQKDRGRFFDNMKGKPSLFEHLVGHLWRIEFSQGAGYHLHIVLVFDGSKVHKHAWLAQKIGEWWANDITDGRGHFHNVNAAWKESDPNCGIGMIEYDDDAKRRNLEGRVLAYLCKSSQIVQVLPYEGANTFGSSELPKPPSGLGRPRGKDQAINHYQDAIKEISYPKSSFPFKNKALQKKDHLFKVGVVGKRGEV